jgi:CspA family cold shock protein
MPTGRVKWFSLEKGFGFISSDEGEDVYLAATALPEGVPSVKPGTKLEFSVIDSRKGPQAMSVHIVDAPVSLAENSRVNNDDLAAMIEDTIRFWIRSVTVFVMVVIHLALKQSVLVVCFAVLPVSSKLKYRFVDLF